MSLCVPEVPQLTPDSSSVLVPVPSLVQVPLGEAVVDELPLSNNISPGPPSEPPGFESVSLPVAPFTNGCRTSKPCPLLEPSQDFDSDIIGDDLDDLLDQARPDSAMVSAVFVPRLDGLLGLAPPFHQGPRNVNADERNVSSHR